ncbi:GGDEF domain-containing protein [Paenibacillus tarimensis]|uniref:GGDEF domain-containing protein n=2 Tax=Paenibacillus tarimensis TaxID=416012 RepID=UPI0039F0FF6D
MMNILNWVSGPNGQIAGASAVATINLLMLSMSILLQRRNLRRGAYKLLNTGLILSLIHTFGIVPAAGLPAAADVGLGLLSFIIINFAMLELYTLPGKLDRLSLLAFAGGAAAAAALQWNAADLPAGGIGPGGITLRPLGLAGIVACALLLSIVLPRIRQKTKYALSLAVYFAFIIAASAHAPQDSLVGACIHILPALYFLFLFLILFERVVERMRSVYVSSIRDGLTGLFNRQHFLKKTRRYLSRGLPVSVIFCDIDNFKRLNDTQGHHQADLVLKQVAGIIIDETSGCGTAGRYGGEELVAAVARPDVKASDVAEVIRARVEAETPVTVSVGWSTVTDNLTIEETVKQADEAMYISKTTGKNKVTAFRPSRAKSS